MKQRPRFVKDKKVRAYKATPRTVWGFERVFKEYLHPQESGGLWAYVRHLSGDQQIKARAVQSGETMQFIIAYSPKLTPDVFLEFGDKTYKIESLDPFEFNKTDLEIRASETAPPTFDEEEYPDD
jgi:SPP1 family predicted phage head-tail adaptor